MLLTALAEYMISLGASTLTVDIWNNTPVHHAALSGYSLPLCDWLCVDGLWLALISGTIWDTHRFYGPAAAVAAGSWLRGSLEDCQLRRRDAAGHCGGWQEHGHGPTHTIHTTSQAGGKLGSNKAEREREKLTTKQHCFHFLFPNHVL